MSGGLSDVLTDEVMFKWEIRNMNKLKAMITKGLCSNEFCTKLSYEMDNKYWQLKMEHPEYEFYNIILRRNYPDSSPCTAKATISVEFFLLYNKHELKKLNDIAKLNFDSSSDFYSYPISAFKLDNKHYEIDNTLTIVCRLVEYGKPRLLSSLEDCLESLSKNMQNLLTSEQQSDVTLIVNEVEFKVHKTILIARSPVFAAMFSHKDFKESRTNQVVIEDTSPEVMAKFIEFTYSAKVEELDKEKFDLWKLAHKYEIESLKNYCEQLIICKIDKQCVLEIFQFANLYNIKNLLSIALNYSLENCKSEILNNKEWTTIAKSNPILVDLFIDHLKKSN